MQILDYVHETIHTGMHGLSLGGGVGGKAFVRGAGGRGVSLFSKMINLQTNKKVQSIDDFLKNL